jgi:hypothetical protein
MSITIPKGILQLSNLMLTPPMMLNPPKGAYSQLFSSLLANYVTEQLGGDLVLITEVLENNPNMTFQELRTRIQQIQEEVALLDAEQGNE